MCLLISCAPVLSPGQVRIQRVINENQQILREKTETAEEKMQVADKLVSIISEYDDIILHRQAVSNSGEDAIRQIKRENIEGTASLLFAAGQQYKNDGQMEKAKQVYQKIIRTFSGSAYGGYRDRARMEIDDLKLK